MRKTRSKADRRREEFERRKREEGYKALTEELHGMRERLDDDGYLIDNQDLSENE